MVAAGGPKAGVLSLPFYLLGRVTQLTVTSSCGVESQGFLAFAGGGPRSHAAPPLCPSPLSIPAFLLTPVSCQHRHPCPKYIHSAPRPHCEVHRQDSGMWAGKLNLREARGHTLLTESEPQLPPWCSLHCAGDSKSWSMRLTRDCAKMQTPRPSPPREQIQSNFSGA